MKISGQHVPLMIQLLAVIADRLTANVDDSTSIYVQLTKPERSEQDIQSFATPEEFEKARRQALGRR